MCISKQKANFCAAQRGISLIELIMFIVIVGIALAGILLVMNNVSKNSSDPLIHKQSLAIAESLLEEIELMPFTYCDPDDTNAANATSATAAQCPGAGGVGGVELIGPETLGGNETRYAAPFFDNVNDYDGFPMDLAHGGIRDITGTAIPSLNNYSAIVAVTPISFQGITLASGDALQVTVTVTGPNSAPVQLDGVRTRYAPRAVP